jgi:hypothetical protein
MRLLAPTGVTSDPGVVPSPRPSPAFEAREGVVMGKKGAVLCL